MVRFALIPALLCLGGACSGPGAPAAATDHLRDTRAIEASGPLVGVSASPDGRLFVIDMSGTIAELTATGVEPIAEGPFGPTDLAALGDDRFAITRPNEGFLLDLTTGELRTHFCYLPEPPVREEQPPLTDRPTMELSQALAYDHAAKLLYANPQTIADDGTQDELFSEVAMFDAISGSEIRFQNLRDASFTAGGMLALGDDELLYGEGSILYRGSFWGGEREALVDLSSYGIESIEGMTRDPSSGVLYVVDDHTLYTIDLAGLLASLDG